MFQNTTTSILHNDNTLEEPASHKLLSFKEWWTTMPLKSTLCPLLAEGGKKNLFLTEGKKCHLINCPAACESKGDLTICYKLQTQEHSSM